MAYDARSFDDDATLSSLFNLCEFTTWVGSTHTLRLETLHANEQMSNFQLNVAFDIFIDLIYVKLN